MTPIWSRAISVHNVVEVPFTIDGKFYLPSLYQTRKNIGRRKLVIYDNGSNGRKGYVVDYMPSETFAGKIKDINSINFRQAKFSGMVDMYNLNHVNLGGFMYEKGKFVQRYHEDRSGVNGKEGDDCTTTEVLECVEDKVKNEIFCDWVFQITCKKPGGGGGGTGGGCDDPNPPPTCDNDPCNGPNPPSYCENGDPCESPNPPPSCGDPCSRPNPPPDCGGGGGCLTGNCDPCDLDPTLPECNPCIPCTDTYGEHNNFAYAEFKVLDVVYISLGSVDFSLAVENVNCSQQTYGNTTLTHTPDIFMSWGWDLERNFEYKNEISKEKINPQEANCGFRLTTKCGGEAKLKIFSGPWSGIPIPRIWSGYANFTFD